MPDLTINEFNGKYRINDFYRPIAEKLVHKFPELKHITVASILFLDNTEGSGKSKDKIRCAQIGTIQEKWSDIIYQFTGKRFDYFIEFFRQNTERLTKEQLITVVYHELAHIGTDGNIRHHSIEEWANIVAKFGPDWLAPHLVIPDLLEDGFQWDGIQSPNLFSSIDEQMINIVKAAVEWKQAKENLKSVNSADELITSTLAENSAEKQLINQINQYNASIKQTP
ncbi:hypothetical protein SCACP_21550 [Sporomusa carbonis]|uniref:putative metallopeptidase n=1 Tax=Sporomusa carbonis TaxID=3076075 RepID=UPI003A6DEE23